MIHPETDPVFTGTIGNGTGPIGPLEFIEKTFREGKTLEAIGDGKTLKNGVYGDYMLFAPPCFTSSNYEQFRRLFDFNQLTEDFGDHIDEELRQLQAQAQMRRHAHAAIRKIESPRPKSPKLQPDDTCLQPDNITMAQRLRLKQQHLQQAAMNDATKLHSRRRHRRGRRGSRNRTRDVPHVHRTARTFGMYLHAAQRRV